MKKNAAHLKTMKIFSNLFFQKLDHFTFHLM